MNDTGELGITPQEIPTHKFPVCIDFCEFMDRLGRAKGYHYMDFAGKFHISQKLNETTDEFYKRMGTIEYQNFWHWMLDNAFNPIHNGSIQYLPFEVIDRIGTPDWVKTILKDIFEAVAFHPACDTEGVNFYVKW